MKEKFKNLSAPVGIVLSIVAVILFTGLLLGLGFVLGKIPGLNEQNDYLLQAIAEFIILIVFLIHRIIHTLSSFPGGPFGLPYLFSFCDSYYAGRM